MLFREKIAEGDVVYKKCPAVLMRLLDRWGLTNVPWEGVLYSLIKLKLRAIKLKLRAAAIPRTRALAKVARRETNGERQHRLVCQYDRRSGPALRGVMEDSYEAASTRDVRFRRWFPNKPRPAFRRGKTLREELVKARLPSGRVVRPRAAARERWEGVRRCSKGQNAVRCQCCSILTETPASVVRSVVVNGREVKVEDAITCKTESVIYVIMSRKDPTRCYGGQTGG